MIKLTVDKVIWMDIENPNPSAIEEIKKLHSFHPIILNELLHPSAYSKAEAYDSYIFFTYHLPIFNKTGKTSSKAEMDFLITANEVITVHYQKLELLDEFLNEIKKSPEFKTLVGDNTGKFIYYLIEKINQFSLRQLAHIEKNIDHINKEIFNNQEHRMLQEISFIKRDVLNYFLITKPQETLLHSLKEAGVGFWGEGMKIYLTDLMADHLKISRQIENYRDTIESLEETNAQLLNAKTNAIMQRFTVLAFLTFPLALFTGIYNIPDVALALNNIFGGFWHSFAVMIILTIATLVVFINKNWF